MSGKTIEFGIPERIGKLLHQQMHNEMSIDADVTDPTPDMREFLSIPTDRLVKEGCMALAGLQDDELRGYLYMILCWIASRRDILQAAEAPTND